MPGMEQSAPPAVAADAQSVPCVFYLSEDPVWDKIALGLWVQACVTISIENGCALSQKLVDFSGGGLVYLRHIRMGGNVVHELLKT